MPWAIRPGGIYVKQHTHTAIFKPPYLLNISRFIIQLRGIFLSTSVLFIIIQFVSRPHLIINEYVVSCAFLLPRMHHLQ